MNARAGLTPRKIDTILVSSRIVVGVFFAFLIPRSTIAMSQEANTQEQGAEPDVFKPPENLFQLMYQYRTTPGSGSTPGSTATVTTDEIRLRLDHRIDLSQQSLLVLRSDLRVVAKDPVTSTNPNGDYLYGLGDADIQAVFAYNFDSRWAAGFGSPQPAGTLSPRESGKSCPSQVYAMGCRKLVPEAILSRTHGTTLASRAILRKETSAICNSRRCSLLAFQKLGSSRSIQAQTFG